MILRGIGNLESREGSPVSEESRLAIVAHGREHFRYGLVQRDLQDGGMMEQCIYNWRCKMEE